MLPSPFLPEVAYEPWVAALRADGLDAVLAPVPRPPDASTLVEVWARLTQPGAVLLPHSNAGYLAPVVSGACGGAPIVFVDAALPEPGPVTRLAPARFRDFLDGLADDEGLLPPWTRWWPRPDYADSLPGDWFERIDAEAPQAPMSYVDAEVTLPPAWEGGSRAYLAFGETYAAELDRAEGAGWPTRRLEGGHLHWLVRPEEAAAAAAELIEAAGVST
ncbi:hypothetical protein [Nocardioides sp.]|uniref:hypothetical protein n=1 Tax=Nocardioides sp. TaxID=35761 RepID=UPI002ED344D0